MSAWVLPDHIADVLPLGARQLEAKRRALLDTARGYGYELVVPPLLEHIESLLTGSGQALDLQTFKLTDLLSGRTLGVRADTTQQVARIDAHLLNRQGVARLCYCGPVLHTRPEQPHASREPLQFGAELYGCTALEADAEILWLAIDALRAAGLAQPLVLDLADARIVPALLAQAAGAAVDEAQVQTALITKNADALQEAVQMLPAAVQAQLHALLDLYGSVDVLEQAGRVLPPLPAIAQALQQMRHLAQQAQAAQDVQVLCDLADAKGYSYYSGVRFALYAQGSNEALVRGGRYDEVGAVFGRCRPAVGFSLDVKTLCPWSRADAGRAAICTPCSDAPQWRDAVAALRRAGEKVVVALPGQAAQPEGVVCDRELVLQGQNWVLRPLG